MVLLLSLLCVSLFVALCGQTIKKQAVFWRICCVLLAFATVPLCLMEQNEPSFWLSLAASLLTEGGLAGVLFLFVMFAGAMPDGSGFQRRVMPLRGELSILASILALGHIAARGLSVFPRLFTGAAELRLSALLASLASLLLALLLLPLFLSSLRCVRRRMKPKRWKRFQRLAYLFYALVYGHIVLFRLPALREEKAEAVLSFCLYSAIFAAYLCLRLSRAAVKRGQDVWLPAIQLGGALLLTGILVLAIRPAAAPQPAARSPSTTVWADGSYKGAAYGYNGRLKVQVVIEDGRLAELTLKSHVEDEPYVTRAETGMFQAMLEGNTPDVDLVSTATTTSEALIEAVHQAIDGAVLAP